MCDLSLFALETLNRGQQISEPGILLPADFPGLATLNAQRYFTAEDLDGAERTEYEDIGLSRDQYPLALAALQLLGYGAPWTTQSDANLLILKPMTLTSGMGARTTPTLDMGLSSTKWLDLTLDVERAEGSAPVLAVALQTSSDLANWDDLVGFSDSTTDGKQLMTLKPQRYVRADYTITGSDSAFLFSLTGKTR